MTIKVIPVRYEAIDECGDLVFAVECFDAGCASVDVKTVVNVELWDTIAPMIRECLVGMQLEPDVKAE